MQGLPSPFSILHSPGSSLFGCPHKYSTEAALGGMGSHRKVRAPKRDAPRSVSAVSLRMAEALAAFALDWDLWRHECLHRHSQAAELGEDSHLRHLRATCHRHNEVGVGGRSLAGSWSRRPDRSCITPWTRMSRDPSSSSTALSGILLPRFLINSHTQQS